MGGITKKSEPTVSAANITLRGYRPLAALVSQCTIKAVPTMTKEENRFIKFFVAFLTLVWIVEVVRNVKLLVELFTGFSDRSTGRGNAKYFTFDRL